MIGPEVLHARPPEMAQESTHRKFTGSRRTRGCCAFRHAAAWGDLQLWRRLGRSATVSGAAAWGGAPSFLSSLSPHWPYAHSVSCLPAVYTYPVFRFPLRGGLAVRVVSLSVRLPVLTPPRLFFSVSPSHSRRGAGCGAAGASSCSPWFFLSY